MGRKLYKVVIMGDPAVGKTSIRHRFLGKEFKQNYMVTLGADFAIKKIDNNVLQIWDLAGNPVYSKIRGNYFKGTDGAILVFDITRLESFQNLKFWIEEMLNHIEKIVPIIIIGNKEDLRSESGEVTYNNGLEYAQEVGSWAGFKVPFLESSAKTGLNIDRMFSELIELIKQNLD